MLDHQEGPSLSVPTEKLWSACQSSTKFDGEVELSKVIFLQASVKLAGRRREVREISVTSPAAKPAEPSSLSTAAPAAMLLSLSCVSVVRIQGKGGDCGKGKGRGS